MLLIIVCGALLVVGLALTAMWSGERLVEPPAPSALVTARTATTEPAKRMPRHLAGLKVYVWWATVFTVLGTVSGLVITGAGGRLIMRLLAETSPQATGSITEAFARVGDITLDGTVSYLIFGALPAAFASAAVYLLVAPWLPPGRLGGPTFGALLLVTVAPFVEPLRTSNFDFAIVGPGWLTLLLFAALAVLQGAFLAALAGRLSRSLPLLTRDRWLVPVSPLLAAVVLVPVGVVLAVGALVAFMFPRALPWILAARASRPGVLVGRILLAVAVIVSLPAFIGAVVTIGQR
ncbi:hypothetical protein [Agromyces cerinus]|uniref:Uncharacterized protein n=1 Tax=Agromyces cerinus subsp. cerinus TaxID=232089 RepID=A0A1N6DQY2_9MICO|nr:hypothetical protein [Agromyces cerinus]SIN73228.1 hypothetical protein SAMN05443544_0622 [Agromyces cerinus subsp. cerinus]